MNTLREPSRFQRILTRIIPALAVTGALVQLLYLWAGLPDLQNNWQVLNSLPAVKSLVEFDVFLLYAAGLRWLGMALSWAAAIVVFRRVNSSSAPPNWAGLLTGLLLALLPGLLLTDVGIRLRLPVPWDQVVMGLSILQGAAVLLGLTLFGLLFPNLRFVPAWTGWLAVPLSAGLLLAIASTAGGGDFYVVAMLLLLILLLIGAGSQVYRYLRRSDANQRRQTVGVVTALVLLPVFFLLQIFLSGSGWPSLINLHVQFLTAVLLPAAILEAVLRRSLWAGDAAQASRERRLLGASVVAVLLLGLAALSARSLLPARGERLEFAPLPASSAPRPVIIDTDMAPDDWMAILFLLQRPDIEVKAITVTGTGETHCDPGVQNALGLAALSGKTGIPVACGRETPLQGQNVFPAEWREAADTMVGLSLPKVEPPSADQDAAALLAQVLEQSPQKVTLLALGPLTNLADGFQQDPDFFANVDMVYVMGGALNVLGNVGFMGIDNQVAEWNIYIDPLAAEIVFESGAPLTLVPLDANNKVPMDMDFYRLLQANRHTPEAEFVYQVLTNRLEDVAGGISSFWDPLAAGLLADESLGYFSEGPVKIYSAPGPSSGLTRINSSGVPMRYATSADRPRFEFEFLRALNQP